ncbi:MAG: hypothetical protein ABEK12_00935 [Candidatus Nanohaloarchaea archaeon]
MALGGIVDFLGCGLLHVLSTFVSLLTDPAVDGVTALFSMLLGSAASGQLGTVALLAVVGLLGFKFVKGHIVWILFLLSLPYWLPAVC